MTTRIPDAEMIIEDEFLLTALHNRRSISKVSPEAPPEHLVRTMLEAATWAPNHFQTEPWRFIVMHGEARERMGTLMGELAAAREDDPGRKDLARERMASKPLRAPYVIAIGVEPDEREKVVELEEIAATSAAAQNMLLAAEALGLGAMWRTGWVAYAPEVREFLGLSERATVLGFVYVGYPAQPAPDRTRKPVDAVTTWME